MRRRDVSIRVACGGKWPSGNGTLRNKLPEDALNVCQSHISSSFRSLTIRVPNLPSLLDEIMMHSEHARVRAEAAFKRKEQARVEGQKAMEEYRAEQRAIREKTARLRALRLARDGA